VNSRPVMNSSTSAPPYPLTNLRTCGKRHSHNIGEPAGL
jgi:hypothetical protein